MWLVNRISKIQKLLAILILIFTLQTPSQADDIRDFQIEGMSIGDSLLDYFSEEEIKKFRNYDNLPSDMMFRIADIEHLNMHNYDGIQVFYKPEDKKFILHSVGGHTYCTDKSEAVCEKMLENIRSDVSKTFKNIKIKKKTFKHFDDKSGKSIVKMYSFEMSKGEINIKYTNWSKNVKWTDNISVSINTTEAIKWMRNNYGAE